jgi:hypothetical protein
MTLAMKIFAAFLVGGAFLSMRWQPAVLAVGFVVTGYCWRRGKALVNAR